MQTEQEEDRINFGGVHKTGVRHPLTNLEMQLIGFDAESGKIKYKRTNFIS